MRINLRKALALMISLLMLCTLIPMGAMTSVSAATNLVSNGTFEDGTTSGWNNVSGSTQTATTTDPGSGNYSFALDCSANDYAWSYIKISVEANTTYDISFKYKTASSALMINFQSNWVDVSADIPRITVGSSSTWKEYTGTFNSAGYTSLMLYFQSSWAKGTGSMLYLDDVVISKQEVVEPETPAAGENLVINGDFEDGSNGWSVNSAGSVVSGGYTGSAFQMSNPTAWSEVARQDIAVEANETYTLTWRSKRISGTGAFNMEIAKAPYDGTKPTVTHVTNYTWMTDTSGEWIEHKASIKMTDSSGNGISKIMIKLTTEADSAGVILIDDICLTKNLTASFDGYIYNGDFELGSIENWVGYNETTASTAAKYSGSYGAHLKGNGSWGGIMYQSTVNVVAGKTYVVSFYIKVLANGMGLQIKDGTTSSGDVLYSKTYGVSSDWQEVSFEVTPTQNGLFINFCGLGSSSSAVSGKEESAYLDDLKVELKGGNPEEKVEYVGSSVRDNDPKDDGSGKGLAFQFTVSATDGVKGYDNKYQEQSGKIALGDQKYTLVRMGAVMTNNATVGQNATGFNLDAVDGKKTIDIPAVYLCGADAESLSFAVRICDIPDNHIGTSIYARPYYVYLDNGVETTVYGATRSNNYAKAANISTADKTKPIKILSIGHSFSKDVMTTNLYNMFTEGGYEDVTIAYLYMAGCSMPKHLYNIQNNLSGYEYAKNNNGSWVSKSNYTAINALKDEDWDFVTVQSSPDYIGGQTISKITLGINSEGDEVTLSSPQTEYEAMGEITDWIKANATNADVKIDYHMIWAFSEGCNLWSYTYHDYDQMTMYENIVEQTQKEVQNHEDINRVIPSATAIQNARSSFMGDTFNMPDASQGGNDGYHLNDYGDYVAALTWYCHYSGDNAQIMAGYLGDGSVLNLTIEEFNAIAEAVNNATDIPYAVTESSYTE